MKFYIESCTVHGENDKSYDVIHDGCGDTDVDATLHSGSSGFKIAYLSRYLIKDKKNRIFEPTHLMKTSLS